MFKFVDALTASADKNSASMEVGVMKEPKEGPHVSQLLLSWNVPDSGDSR